jgi:transposase-like protein
MDRRNLPRSADRSAAALDGTDAANLMNVLHEARFAEGRPCPHCMSTRVQRWGVRGGRQRRRCTACNRTFSDFTGTRFAYHKRIHRLADYCHAMLRAESVRVAAASCGIHPTTSFRWRHLLLAELRDVAAAPRGLVEVREVRFLYSEKGSRHLDRPALRRGARGFEAQRQRYWALLVRDRCGTTHAMATGTRPPSLQQLAQLLTPPPSGVTELVAAAGRFSPYARYCRRNDIAFHSCRPQDPLPRPHRLRSQPLPPLPTYDVRNAAAAAARLHAWMKRFRGVASRYLDNYLRWHALADERHRSAAELGHTRAGGRRRWVSRAPAFAHHLREQSTTNSGAAHVPRRADFRMEQPP